MMETVPAAKNIINISDKRSIAVWQMHAVCGMTVIFDTWSETKSLIFPKFKTPQITEKYISSETTLKLCAFD